MVLAIDPGTTHSGVVKYDPLIGKVEWADKAMPNEDVCNIIFQVEPFTTVVCEWIESMGMAVGREVFETCRWVGRFEQCAMHCDWATVTRRQVKLHLCGSMRAKDANVRQALLDRFGGKAAKGTKKAPGPLFGVSSHAWSALAVAVTWVEGGAE